MRKNISKFRKKLTDTQYFGREYYRQEKKLVSKENQE